jgi:hypothetical protein
MSTTAQAQQPAELHKTVGREPNPALAQVVADQQWQTVQIEDTQNEELLDLSHQILELTKQVHAYATARSDGAPTA